MPMHTQNTLQLISGLFGGGLASVLVNLFWQNRRSKIDRKADRLKSQINSLYGPLFYLTSISDDCFKQNEKMIEAYKVKFEGGDWSEDENTQRELKKDATVTIDLANEYVRLVTENNEKIQKILSDQYPYIEPEDIDIFRQHLIDYMRMKIEFDSKGVLRTPLDIYSHLGDISFMRPAFIEAVKSRFEAKKRELDKLTG